MIKSIKCAVKFLKSNTSLTVAENIHLTRRGILSLAVHKSVPFMQNFVDLCSNRLPTQLDDSSLESVMNGEYSELTKALRAHSKRTVVLKMLFINC